jgi:Leucine-rich repeat (LRR) protein
MERFIAITFLILFVQACGGGSGSNSDNSISPGDQSSQSSSSFSVSSKVTDPYFARCLESQAQEHAWRGNSDVREITCFPEDVTDIGWGVSSLAGIEDFVNLRYLKIVGGGHSEGHLKTINEIRSLPNLEHIELWEGHIGSLEPLRGLTSIKTFVISNFIFADITPITSLTNLEELRLIRRGTRVEGAIEFATMANLTKLKRLHLERVFYDIGNDSDEFFLAMPQLETLSMISTNLRSFGVLQNLTNLNHLDLIAVRLQNEDEAPDYGLSLFDVLSTMTDIHTLGLSIADVDLSFLNNYEKLRTLYLDRYSFHAHEMAAINSRVSLEELSISNFHEFDVSALANLTNLKLLSLQSGRLRTDAATIPESLSGLESLYLWDAFSHFHFAQSPISLSFIEHLTNLKDLQIYRTPFLNIESVNGFEKIQHIGLVDIGLSDTSIFEGMPKLRTINMAANQIEDIDGLLVLDDIEHLNVSSNRISCSKIRAFWRERPTVTFTSSDKKCSLY